MAVASTASSAFSGLRDEETENFGDEAPLLRRQDREERENEEQEQEQEQGQSQAQERDRERTRGGGASAQEVRELREELASLKEAVQGLLVKPHFSWGRWLDCVRGSRWETYQKDMKDMKQEVLSLQRKQYQSDINFQAVQEMQVAHGKTVKQLEDSQRSALKDDSNKLEKLEETVNALHTNFDELQTMQKSFGSELRDIKVALPKHTSDMKSLRSDVNHLRRLVLETKHEDQDVPAQQLPDRLLQSTPVGGKLKGAALTLPQKAEASPVASAEVVKEEAARPSPANSPSRASPTSTPTAPVAALPCASLTRSSASPPTEASPTTVSSPTSSPTSPPTRPPVNRSSSRSCRLQPTTKIEPTVGSPHLNRSSVPAATTATATATAPKATTAPATASTETMRPAQTLLPAASAEDTTTAALALPQAIEAAQATQAAQATLALPQAAQTAQAAQTSSAKTTLSLTRAKSLPVKEASVTTKAATTTTTTTVAAATTGTKAEQAATAIAATTGPTAPTAAAAAAAVAAGVAASPEAVTVTCGATMVAPRPAQGRSQSLAAVPVFKKKEEKKEEKKASLFDVPPLEYFEDGRLSPEEAQGAWTLCCERIAFLERGKQAANSLKGKEEQEKELKRVWHEHLRRASPDKAKDGNSKQNDAIWKWFEGSWIPFYKSWFFEPKFFTQPV